MEGLLTTNINILSSTAPVNARQTSFKTTIHTIMNRITAHITSHICQCAVSSRISAVLHAQH